MVRRAPLPDKYTSSVRHSASQPQPCYAPAERLRFPPFGRISVFFLLFGPGRPSNRLFRDILSHLIALDDCRVGSWLSTNAPRHQAPHRLKPAAVASNAWIITQTLVQTPAMIKVNLPVARTALTKSCRIEVRGHSVARSRESASCPRSGCP